MKTAQNSALFPTVKMANSRYQGAPEVGYGPPIAWSHYGMPGSSLSNTGPNS